MEKLNPTHNEQAAATRYQTTLRGAETNDDTSVNQVVPSVSLRSQSHVDVKRNVATSGTVVSDRAVRDVGTPRRRKRKTQDEKKKHTTAVEDRNAEVKAATKKSKTGTVASAPSFSDGNPTVPLLLALPAVPVTAYSDSSGKVCLANGGAMLPKSAEEVVHAAQVFETYEKHAAAAVEEQRREMGKRLETLRANWYEEIESLRTSERKKLRHRQRRARRAYQEALEEIARKEQTWIQAATHHLYSSFHQWYTEAVEARTLVTRSCTTRVGSGGPSYFAKPLQSKQLSIDEERQWLYMVNYRRYFLKLWIALFHPGLRFFRIAILNFPIAIEPLLKYYAEQCDKELISIACHATIQWHLLNSPSVHFDDDDLRAHFTAHKSDTDGTSDREAVCWSLVDEQLMDLEKVGCEWRSSTVDWSARSTSAPSSTSTTLGHGQMEAAKDTLSEQKSSFVPSTHHPGDTEPPAVIDDNSVQFPKSIISSPSVSDADDDDNDGDEEKEDEDTPKSDSNTLLGSLANEPSQYLPSINKWWSHCTFAASHAPLLTATGTRHYGADAHRKYRKDVRKPALPPCHTPVLPAKDHGHSSSWTPRYSKAVVYLFQRRASL